MHLEWDTEHPEAVHGPREHRCISEVARAWHLRCGARTWVSRVVLGCAGVVLQRASKELLASKTRVSSRDPAAAAVNASTVNTHRAQLCWAVNFCAALRVAASAVALRGPARSGRRAAARGSLRTGALDRRGPNALGPQRDTSRAPLSRSALHSLHLGHSRRRGSSSVHSTPLSCATRSSCSQIASWTLAAHRTLHLVCGLPPRLLSLRSGGPTGAVACSRAELARRATVRRDRCAARRRLCSPQGRGMPIAHRQRVRFPPAAHVAQLAPTPLSSTCRA